MEGILYWREALLPDTGNNMLGPFQPAYAVDALAFFNKYGEYSSANETTTASKDKIAANNAVYLLCVSIMEDGKAIGQATDDAAFSKLFRWNDLKNIITQPGAASLGALIQDLITQLPFEGVNIKITREGDAAIVFDIDVNGEVLFSSIPAGTYVVMVFKFVYVTQTNTKVVSVGVNVRLVVLFEAGATP